MTIPLLNAWIITAFAFLAFWVVWKLKCAIDRDRAAFNATRQEWERRFAEDYANRHAAEPTLHRQAEPVVAVAEHADRHILRRVGDGARQQVGTQTLFWYQPVVQGGGAEFIDGVWVTQRPGERARLEVLSETNNTHISIGVRPQDLRTIAFGLLDSAQQIDGHPPGGLVPPMTPGPPCPRCGRLIDAGPGSKRYYDGPYIVCGQCDEPRSMTAWERLIKEDE